MAFDEFPRGGRDRDDDEAFFAWLREELRKARARKPLPPSPEQADARRREAVADFKTWTEPMMALGSIPRSVFDTFVAHGVKMGLSASHASELIRELAAEHGAVVEDEPGVR